MPNSSINSTSSFTLICCYDFYKVGNIFICSMSINGSSSFCSIMGIYVCMDRRYAYLNAQTISRPSEEDLVPSPHIFDNGVLICALTSMDWALRNASGNIRHYFALAICGKLIFGVVRAILPKLMFKPIANNVAKRTSSSFSSGIFFPSSFVNKLIHEFSPTIHFYEKIS